MKHTTGERMNDLFNIIRPLIAFTWDNVIFYINTNFVSNIFVIES